MNKQIIIPPKRQRVQRLCLRLLLLYIGVGCLPRTASAQAEDSLRYACGVDYVTEGQFNLRNGQAAWANRLDLELGAKLWRNARADLGLMATWRQGDDVASVCQDFSNINAPGKALRLTQAGLTQTFGSAWSLFAGLGQVDRAYFDTPMASLFTGASYGCLPTLADNFHINVYPLSALGLQLSYSPVESLTLRASLWNGNAGDTPSTQFRFRPKADGIIHVGSLTWEQSARDGEPLTPLWQVGWNVGNHYRPATGGRHTQAGFWLTAEQPVCRLGRAHLHLGGTFSREFSDPEVAKTYWNLIAACHGVGTPEGTLAVVVERAFYHDAHETDVELTWSQPLTSWLTLQPAVHFLRTSGRSQTVGQIRLSCSF